MKQFKYSLEETDKRSRAIYEAIRAQVETPENNGKPILIDVENGTYEIDHEDVQRGNCAQQRLLSRHPDAEIVALRIGWPAFGKMGGSWATAFARMKRERSEL